MTKLSLSEKEMISGGKVKAPIAKAPGPMSTWVVGSLGIMAFSEVVNAISQFAAATNPSNKYSNTPSYTNNHYARISPFPSRSSFGFAC